MKVTIYTRQNCTECLRVRDMLAELAPVEGFTLHEAPTPAGAPAPCVRFDAPGSPFYRAEGLTAEQFGAYLEGATRLLQTGGESATGGRVRVVRRSGAPPSAEYEISHPVRSFLWRHRVGSLVSALSLFVGLAWAAPITLSLGMGDGFYNVVRGFYRIVCDQIPQRSAQLGGVPVCLCWRCTAIYGGSLLLGIMYTIGRNRKLRWLRWLTSPISLPMLLLYVLPLTLDGVSHAAGWRPGVAYATSPDFWVSWGTFSADWWLRIATSLVATTGAVKFLCPRLDKVGSEYEKLYEARTQIGDVLRTPQAQASGVQAV